MNWGKIAKYTVALVLAQFAIGFLEGSFAAPSSKILVASSLASFLAGTAIFAHLSFRHGRRPFTHAWSVLILQGIIGAALLLGLVGSLRAAFPPLALLEFGVLVGALVAGTTLGSHFRRSAGHPAGA
jgi:CDP-diglyceride synthetase